MQLTQVATVLAESFQQNAPQLRWNAAIVFLSTNKLPANLNPIVTVDTFLLAMSVNFNICL